MTPAPDRIDCGTHRYPVGRIFCIGRNYAEHVKELANPVPDQPLIFLKPPTAILPPGQPILLDPRFGALHFETELVLLIAEEILPDTLHPERHLAGFALGLDLTRRDLQDQLKRDGHPWERAKAFDHSAPLGLFTPYHPQIHELDNLQFTGTINGTVRQIGHTKDLLFPIPHLLTEIAQTWPLRPGDLIYTGTPAGVGPLAPGDHITLTSPNLTGAHWHVQ